MNMVKLALPVAIMATLGGCIGDSGSNPAPPPTTTNSTTSTPTTTTTTTTTAAIAVPSSVIVSPGYTVSVFAQSPGVSSVPPTCATTSPSCFTKPDSVVQLGTGAGSTIFVAYQDALQPNGAISSTNAAIGNDQIVQYDLNGNQLAIYTVPGHNDGLLVYNSTTIWAMSDEDGNPLLSIINLGTGAVTTYAADAPPASGGGLDDLQLIGGNVYVSGSNPTLDAATGLYDKPAIYSITLNSTGNTFHLTSVMAGNASAYVINPATAGVAVNSSGYAMLGNPLVPNGAAQNPAGLQDPDSMSIDPNGNLVLDSQGDSTLVFVTNPGPSQTLKELFLTLYTNPWPVDDTRWAPASSQFMLVTDTPGNLIYKVTFSGGFTQSSMYSAGQGTVLQDDMTTGYMTPIVTGMNSPHGILFVQ